MKQVLPYPSKRRVTAWLIMLVVSYFVFVVPMREPWAQLPPFQIYIMPVTFVAALAFFWSAINLIECIQQRQAFKTALDVVEKWNGQTVRVILENGQLVIEPEEDMYPEQQERETPEHASLLAEATQPVVFSVELIEDAIVEWIEMAVYGGDDPCINADTALMQTQVSEEDINGIITYLELVFASPLIVPGYFDATWTIRDWAKKIYEDNQPRNMVL